MGGNPGSSLTRGTFGLRLLEPQLPNLVNGKMSFSQSGCEDEIRKAVCYYYIIYYIC